MTVLIPDGLLIRVEKREVIVEKEYSWDKKIKEFEAYYFEIMGY
jgi:hypothetical protein